jgi:hypothetical protein
MVTLFRRAAGRGFESYVNSRPRCGRTWGGAATVQIDLFSVLEANRVPNSKFVVCHSKLDEEKGGKKENRNGVRDQFSSNRLRRIGANTSAPTIGRPHHRWLNSSDNMFRASTPRICVAILKLRAALSYAALIP